MGEQHILNEISNTRKMSKYHCLLKKKTKQNIKQRHYKAPNYI